MTSTATAAAQCPPLPNTAGAEARPTGKRPLHPMHWRDEYPARDPDAPLFSAQALELQAEQLKHRVLALVAAWPRECVAPSVVSLLPVLALQRDGQGRRLFTAHYSAVHRALELLAADGLIARDERDFGWRATGSGGHCAAEASGEAAYPTEQREVAA